MDRLDRIYALHRILRAARRPVPRSRIAEQLECTESTVYRVRNALATHFGAPIESEQGTGNLYYAKDADDPFELPGLWFNASELHALLTAEQLLADVQPGLLAEELKPLRQRIRGILEHRQLGSGELAHRVRILAIADRQVDSAVFRTLASALVDRKQLRIRYVPRSHGSESSRLISPQRLTRYRDNWYLDAWCHTRKGIRCFSVDRISEPQVQAESARDIDEAELDAYLTTAYGIFAGNPSHMAVLRFEPRRAQWIASETWHPGQTSQWLDNGCYELSVPYGNPTELILDILRYGDEVEVVEPLDLREAVAARLRKAAEQYA